MVSDKFRQQLRQEAEQWQAEGLIRAEQYQQLAERYQFETLETVARDRFVVVVIGLGSVLLGLSVITFVAANWQAIPRFVQIILLLMLFLSVNATGFYLWKRPIVAGRQGWQQRFGQGLLLLGSLILGANITLMGQMFHISGSGAELCLMWGLGVLIMAYAIRLLVLGVLAILLMGVGYWFGIQELYGAGVLPGLQWMLQYMPLVAAGLFVPLAYWCRSKAVFTLGAIAVFSAFEVVLLDFGTLFTEASGILLALAFTLPPALLWSYDDRPWIDHFSALRSPTPDASTTWEHSFPPFSRGLAVLFLTVLIYILSFHSIWTINADIAPLSTQFSHLFTTGLPFLLNPNVLILGGITLGQWIYLARPRQHRRRWGFGQTDRLMLLLLVTVGLMAFWHWSIAPIMPIATFILNVLLFLLAAKFMREGLADGHRSLFWSGMVLLTLQILSRMLEYDTGLLLKSLAFLLCGIGVLLIGLWFERHVRTLKRNIEPFAQD